MNVIFTIGYTGTPDQEDALAARHAVTLENQRRANLVPPLSALPFATPAELKASYLGLLTERVMAIHIGMAQFARNESGMLLRFTPAQVAQINTNLVSRLNAGESAASLVTDTAA